MTSAHKSSSPDGRGTLMLRRKKPQHRRLIGRCCVQNGLSEGTDAADTHPPSPTPAILVKIHLVLSSCCCILAVFWRGPAGGGLSTYGVCYLSWLVGCAEVRIASNVNVNLKLTKTRPISSLVPRNARPGSNNEIVGSVADSVADRRRARILLDLNERQSFPIFASK